MSTPSYARQLPIRLRGPEEFALVSEFLKRHCFDEQTMCRELKIESMSDVGTCAAVDLSHLSKELQILIRLFLYQAMVPYSEVADALSPEILQTLFSLGLIGTGEFGDNHLYASVLLYPVAGFHMTSDRASNPDGSNLQAPDDAVFPAIYQGTLRFLQLLPVSPAAEALDLCAGSGVGALVLSRTCDRAVSADLTERASQFARFNAALNARNGVEVVSGDLYDAVAGRTFDRIVAHPPYVPSVNTSKIWRDGGATGESLVRRVVEGVPAHLRPGGLFCMVSIGLDTRAGSFEERVRTWLGSASSEFDLVFAWLTEQTPRDILRNLAEKEKGLNLSEVQQLAREFDHAEVVKVPYGALFIRRRLAGSNQEPLTERRRLSKETNGADFERTLTLRDLMMRSDFHQVLLNTSLTLAPWLEVKVTHVVHDGELLPADYVFEVDRPFSVTTHLEASMVSLATSFKGTETAVEVYKVAKARGELPDGFGLEHYAKLLGLMVHRGFLLLPDELLKQET